MGNAGLGGSSISCLYICGVEGLTYDVVIYLMKWAGELCGPQVVKEEEHANCVANGKASFAGVYKL